MPIIYFTQDAVNYTITTETVSSTITSTNTVETTATITVTETTATQTTTQTTSNAVGDGVSMALGATSLDLGAGVGGISTAIVTNLEMTIVDIVTSTISELNTITAGAGDDAGYTISLGAALTNDYPNGVVFNQTSTYTTATNISETSTQTTLSNATFNLSFNTVTTELTYTIQGVTTG